MAAELPADPQDVRMRGFTRRSTVDQAWAWIRQHIPLLSSEQVSVWQAAGRVLATDVIAPANVPTFDRSMMDGYAVQAADTLGAGPYSPLPLQVLGQSLPGQPFAGEVRAGQAVRIMTGAPMPRGADAVLPAERAQLDVDKLLVLDELPPQKHVGLNGEDIAAGSLVLKSGRRLRPQDVGLLSSLGLSSINVVRQPRVKLLISGNELVSPGNELATSQIHDANGPLLWSLVMRDGGLPFFPKGDGYILRDDPETILAALQDTTADVILVSGGSSVGQEDHAPRLLAQLGKLAVHGIAMRPSSPAGMGRIADALVFLLPGNPVSCLCAYDFFAGAAIRSLGGLPWNWPYPRQRLPLRNKLVSVVGRVDYARVRVAGGQVEPLAISGASILSSTTRADGFVVIPADSEGYAPGVEVDVYLYDQAGAFDQAVTNA